MVVINFSLPCLLGLTKSLNYASGDVKYLWLYNSMETKWRNLSLLFAYIMDTKEIQVPICVGRLDCWTIWFVEYTKGEAYSTFWIRLCGGFKEWKILAKSIGASSCFFPNIMVELSTTSLMIKLWSLAFFKTIYLMWSIRKSQKYLVGTTNCALCCCYKSTSWEKKWQINLNVWCANATTSILYTCKKLLWDYCLILLITLFGYMIIYVLAIFFLKLYKEQCTYIALLKKVIIMPIDYRCMVLPNYNILWLNINPSRSLISCVSLVFYLGGTQNVVIEGIIIVAEIVITPTKGTLEEACSSAYICLSISTVSIGVRLYGGALGRGAPCLSSIVCLICCEGGKEVSSIKIYYSGGGGFLVMLGVEVGRGEILLDLAS